MYALRKKFILIYRRIYSSVLVTTFISAARMFLHCAVPYIERATK